MRNTMMRIGTMFMMICVLALSLPVASFADPDPATMNAQQVNTETARLNTEKQTVEGQIQQIGQSPARPGESLQEEINRKRDETRELRRRLDAINARLAALADRTRQLTPAATPAPAPPAVSTGATTEYVPISDQDTTSRPWQIASGQRDPLWGHGYNPRAGEKPEGAQSEDNDQTVWVHRDGSSPGRITSDPNDRGWWINGNGQIQTSLFHPRSTQCQPCVWLVQVYNAKMRSLIYGRGALESDRRDKSAVLDAERARMQKRRKPEESDLDFAGRMALRIQEVSAAYDAKLAARQRELEQLERDMKEVAAQIAVCEQQCGPDVPKTGITLGGYGGWVPAAAGTLNPDLVLPIRWEGPYRTDCDPCKEIARSLNSIPPDLWVILEEIYHKKMALLTIEAEANFNNLFTGEYASEAEPLLGIPAAQPVNSAAVMQRIRQAIAQLQRDAALKVLEFHRLKEQLTACEKEKCKKIGMIPGLGTTDGEYALVSTELEYTVSVSGTNPLDPYEIERIPNMVNNTEMGGVNTFIPPTTPIIPTAPVVPATPPTAPTTPTTPTTPVPFVVTATGAFTFAHVVGASSCPQPAGTANVTSSSGNPLTISGVSVSGSLSSRLNTSVAGSGTNTPQVSAQFNCSSSTNGAFTGTVTGTATDTVTGESGTFSIPATGSVSG